MNYKTLKTIIESIITNFKCPDCNSECSENDFEILWASWWTVNLNCHCKKCSKNSFIKAEMNQIPLNIKNLNKDILQNLKNNLEQKIWELKITSNTKVTINEKEIIELKDVLKNKNLNVSDLLK